MSQRSAREIHLPQLLNEEAIADEFSNWFRPQMDAEKCLREGRGKACNLCEQACPEGINLHDVAAGETTLNDCSKCRACADVCPEHAITFPLLPKKQAQATPLPVDDEIPERG